MKIFLFFLTRWDEKGKSRESVINKCEGVEGGGGEEETVSAACDG